MRCSGRRGRCHSRPLRTLFRLTHVQPVPQTVPEKIDREHHRGDGDAGGQHQMGRHQHVADALADHARVDDAGRVDDVDVARQPVGERVERLVFDNVSSAVRRSRGSTTLSVMNQATPMITSEDAAVK